jgi:ABC-type proline/glycine betaine transport system permease subunit
MELALWGAGAGAVAYFVNPTPLSVGIGVAVGILYARSRPDKKSTLPVGYEHFRNTYLSPYN